jgi:hypothetical protein
MRFKMHPFGFLFQFAAAYLCKMQQKSMQILKTDVKNTLIFALKR